MMLLGAIIVKKIRDLRSGKKFILDPDLRGKKAPDPGSPTLSTR
jgi:hypothetical protein